MAAAKSCLAKNRNIHQSITYFMKWSESSNIIIKATMLGLCEYINQVPPFAARWLSRVEPMIEITSDLLIPSLSCFSFASETGTLHSHHQKMAQKSIITNKAERKILSFRDFITWCLTPKQLPQPRPLRSWQRRRRFLQPQFNVRRHRRVNRVVPQHFLHRREFLR